MLKLCQLIHIFYLVSNADWVNSKASKIRIKELLFIYCVLFIKFLVFNLG